MSVVGETPRTETPFIVVGVNNEAVIVVVSRVEVARPIARLGNLKSSKLGPTRVYDIAKTHVPSTCTSRTDQRGNCRPKPRLGRSTWLLAPLVRKWRKETGLASPEPIDTRHLPRA